MTFLSLFFCTNVNRERQRWCINVHVLSARHSPMFDTVKHHWNLFGCFPVVLCPQNVLRSASHAHSNWTPEEAIENVLTTSSATSLPNPPHTSSRGKQPCLLILFFIVIGSLKKDGRKRKEETRSKKKAKDNNLQRWATNQLGTAKHKKIGRRVDDCGVSGAAAMSRSTSCCQILSLNPCFLSSETKIISNQCKKDKNKSAHYERSR